MAAQLEWSGAPEYMILFKDNKIPPMESLDPLKPTSIQRHEDGGWTADFRDIKGCMVSIVQQADPSIDLSNEIQMSPGLSDKEKASIAKCGSAWSVLIDAGPGLIYKARKESLIALGKILKTIKAGSGLYMNDSLRVWSIQMLADELKTDAALDIESLYVIHAVANEDGSRWVHTHGLSAAGGFDIDILNPSDGMLDMCMTLIRALAFAIIDKDLTMETPVFSIAHPGGDIRMIPVDEFDAHADTRYVSIRDTDENHRSERAVMCEPNAKKGLFGLGKSRIVPSRFVMSGSSDNMIVAMSQRASDLTARRASETYPILVETLKEFESLQLPALAKVACPVDSGEGHEHIWFEIHNADMNGIDATCVNQPYNIASLDQGDRGRYGFGQISDWQIQTPIGVVNPRQLSAIRHLRANREEIERIMREHAPERI